MRVTGAAPGFESHSVVTAATAKVALSAAAKATKLPSISGTARFDQTLKATTGTWDRSGATFTYQWLRGGTAIKGATSASYKIQAADVGKAISVRVSAKIPGRVDGVATSKAKGSYKITASFTPDKTTGKSVASGKAKAITLTVK